MKSGEKLISIIMPVWNTEKFLGCAIDSIRQQTYKAWELILVDDGSSDKSLEIGREYAAYDLRIKVISKKNGGVSSARNCGIKQARGDWLYFMDSDDWLEAECFEKALAIAEEYKSDIVCWNLYYNYTDGEKRGKEIYPEVQLFENPDELVKITMFPQYDEIQKHRYLGAIRSVWNKLFRAELIRENNILFSETVKIGEDALFCAMCFEKADRLVAVNNYLYHYREFEFSANRRFRKDVLEVYRNSIVAFMEFMGTNLYRKDYATCYKGMIWSYVNRILDKKIVNSENTDNLIYRLIEMKSFLNLQEVKRAFLYKTNGEIYRIDQKIMLYLIKHKFAAGLYLFQICKNIARKFRV